MSSKFPLRGGLLGWRSFGTIRQCFTRVSCEVCSVDGMLAWMKLGTVTIALWFVGY